MQYDPRREWVELRELLGLDLLTFESNIYFYRIYFEDLSHRLSEPEPSKTRYAPKGALLPPKTRIVASQAFYDFTLLRFFALSIRLLHSKSNTCAWLGPEQNLGLDTGGQEDI